MNPTGLTPHTEQVLCYKIRNRASQPNTTTVTPPVVQQRLHHAHLLGDGELGERHLVLLQPLPYRLQVRVDPLQLLVMVQRRENLVYHVPEGWTPIGEIDRGNQKSGQDVDWLIY